MPSFRESAVIAAPPESVWRLVHDPDRMGEWLIDTERVEPGDEEGTVTRYLHGWPDVPMPTRVTSAAENGRVVISCLVSDIDFRFTLRPDAAGCAVDCEVTLPAHEAARAEGVHALVVASLARLADRAAAPGGGLG